MLLASLDDVEARLARLLTSSEQVRASALLVEASASVRAWLRRVPDPVPDDVSLVVSRMVARVIVAPTGPTHLDQFTQAAGPFSHSGTFTDGATSGSPWMTKDDKRILRQFGSVRTAASFDTR